MEIRPILSAMRRNKVGAMLIMLQMAITLAILCNALFIIEQRLEWSRRPTGVQEENVFTLSNQWIGAPTDLAARLTADLVALRAVPGVVSAYAANSFPLSEGGSTDGCDQKPGQEHTTTLCAIYFADEHGLATLGLKLVAGRNFVPSEVQLRDDLSFPRARAVIITQGLADKLFPGQSALGRMVYTEVRPQGSPVVGVVERLQPPWTQMGGWGSAFNEMSLIQPVRYVSSIYFYVIRSQPDRVRQVMQAVQKALYDAHRDRVLEDVKTMAESRADAYQDDHALAVILATVCCALLAVTAFGIVGLTSYWVSQRRRQIGIRRALGATRRGILRYFQTENLLIAGAGAVLGVGLALAANQWMVQSFEMQRLHLGYALFGAVVVMLLGQAAVLYPALRAASIPPALATRGA